MKYTTPIGIVITKNPSRVRMSQLPCHRSSFVLVGDLLCRLALRLSNWFGVKHSHRLPSESALLVLVFKCFYFLESRVRGGSSGRQRFWIVS